MTKAKDNKKLVKLEDAFEDKGVKLTPELAKILSIKYNKESCGWQRNVRYHKDLDVFTGSCALRPFDYNTRHFPPCLDPRTLPNWSNPGGKYADLDCGPYKYFKHHHKIKE